MLKKIIDYLSIKKRKHLFKKDSYSFGGVDLLINYLFKGFKKGIYVDVGAQHPISNNNTFLLFKRGWCGVNIDLDKENISYQDFQFDKKDRVKKNVIMGIDF